MRSLKTEHLNQWLWLRCLRLPALLLWMGLASDPGAAQVIIPDQNLEAAIRSAISKPVGPLNASDLAGLTSLFASGRAVADLSGLEWATNLISLDLSWNAITDLSPLARLTNLVHLSLEANRVMDISPLAKLSNLTSLNVGDNFISHVSVLAGLTNLTSLWLYHNSIDSLTPLRGLSRLTSLILYSSGLADIQPLAALTNLTYLELRWNRLINAGTTLAGLTNLTSLYLGGTALSKLSFLRGLTRLTFLNLDHNTVTDLSPLAALNQLRGLDVSYNPLTNLTQVLALTNLTRLYWSGNSVSNVTALTNLSGLAALTLYHNSISDPSPLERLTGLDDLGLSWNPIPDHAALAGLANLTSLWLDGNSISNLSFVQGLTLLKALSVRYDRLHDLAALAGLTNMVAVFADYNLLTNLSGLGGLPYLSRVQVVGNLLDLSAGSLPLTTIQELQGRGANVFYVPQNQSPIISVRPEWILAADATSSLHFNVSDDLTSDDQLVVTATSSNKKLIPDSSILLSGTNQNRTLRVTPAIKETGTATITLTVTDDAGLTAVGTVLVRVVVSQLLILPDANLEASLRQVLDKPTGALNNVDLIGLTQLQLNDPAISNLSGLEWATNLAVLSVAANTISNVNVLQNLTHLEALSLRCDVLDDYATLGHLTNLITLDLTGNSITDLSFLETLHHLTGLTLVNCRLRDVAPLATLTNLNFLYLPRNRLADISPLTNLVNLQISDFRLNLLETTNNAALDALQRRGVFVLYLPQRPPPTLAVSRFRLIPWNETALLDFHVTDEVTPSRELFVTARSSNTNLIPDSGLLLGGTDQARTLTITPAADQTGTATITLTVTDDAGLTAVGTVLVTVLRSQPLVILDPYLEESLRAVLAKPTGALNNVDLMSLTGLHLEAPAVLNLAGLEWATNLTDLTVAAHTVSNLDVLPYLTHLESLSLHGHVVDDYSLLAGLTDLRTLELAGNAIDNLGFLDNLTNLTSLALVDCRLAEVSEVAALTNLSFLDLRQNRLMDISPLTNLPNLHLLDVRLNLLETSTNAVLDFLRNQLVYVLDRPQRGPPSLTVSPVWIIATNATSSLAFSVADEVTPSEELLVAASCSNKKLIPESRILLGGTNENRTLTVTPAAKETGTATITLTVTNDAGLTAVGTVRLAVVVPQALIISDPNLEASLRQVLGKPTGALYHLDLILLTELHLSDSAISNLSGLEWATNLNVLSVTANTISNLNVLAHLTHLEALSLHCNAVDDYAPLGNLTNLITLDLTGISIGNLSFLESLHHLTDLTLASCRLTDVAPLAALTNLMFLDLQQNRLTDIRPLTNLLYLVDLDLRGNLLETSTNVALSYLLDQGVSVQYEPQRTPPTLVTSTSGWFMAANATSYARLSALDDGPANQQLTITTSSSDARLAPNTNLVVTPDTMGRPGDWILTVIPPTNYTGQSTITLTAANDVGLRATTAVQLTIAMPLPLDGRLFEGTNVAWLTGGTAPWFGQTNIAHEGGSAAQSGSIFDNEESWLEAAVVGPGVLSFWWKVSSEPEFDRLELYVNGVVQTNQISGQMDWQPVTFAFPPGPQTIRWRYVKDRGWSEGLDAAWLDQVVFKPDTNPFPLITSITTTSGVAVITWNATVGQRYRVQYKDGLIQPDWFDLFPDVLAIAPTATYTDAGDLSHRFYRVLVVP